MISQLIYHHKVVISSLDLNLCQPVLMHKTGRCQVCFTPIQSAFPQYRMNEFPDGEHYMAYVVMACFELEVAKQHAQELTKVGSLDFRDCCL